MENKFTIKSYNDYIKAIDELWETSLNKNIYPEILKRGYAVPENIGKADLLIIGINPSFGKTENDIRTEYKHTFPCFEELKGSENKTTYWKEIFKFIPQNIKCEHIDLFTIREAEQNKINEIGSNSSGLDFLVKHMWITQQMIENVIKPKLIVLANRGAGAYFGKHPQYTWIGYDLEPYYIEGLETINSPKEEGELCSIAGFKKDAISRFFLSDEEFSNRYTELPEMKILFGCMQSPQGIPLKEEDKRTIQLKTIQSILNHLK